MASSVLVVAGGAPIVVPVGEIGSFDLVIAADSGVDRAAEVGLGVDVAVGDFDSVSAEALARAGRSGAELVNHPTVKDETDLELAMLLAGSGGTRSITVIGLGGGRIDHHLANYFLLADDRFAAFAVDAYEGSARVSVIHECRTIVGRVGELVSLLPIGGDTTGVTTTGLAYALDNSTLTSSSPRGVSNIMTEASATVSVEEGTLLVVQPEFFPCG